MNLEKDIYSRLPITLQTVLLNVKALELYFERYGKKFQNKLNEFTENEFKKQNEIDTYQNNELNKIIRHAYDSVPYYHNTMRKLRLKPEDIKSKDDLIKLPVLKREDLIKYQKDLISTKYPKYKMKHGHTSGTTGSPLDIFYDINTCVTHLAAVWRQKKAADVVPGEIFATLQGRVIVPTKQKSPPFWRKNFINNQLFMSSFHLDNKNLHSYYDVIKKKHIRIIEGYPSTLYIFALFLNRNNLKLPMKAVFTSSETLFENQKIEIETAFQTPIFDYYGMAERTVFASECAEHKGKHINSDYSIVEFLDSDNNPVGCGRLGKIVATSLHNFAMPLIRYQTNDSSILLDKKCKCGSIFPMMDDVATKNESIVTLPDGRLISPSVLTHPFKPMNNIIESQIIQEKIDTLRVKIVRKAEYSNSDEEVLRSAFLERLGGQMNINIEYVNEIGREKSGKFRWVISKIVPKF